MTSFDEGYNFLLNKLVRKQPHIMPVNMFKILIMKLMNYINI